MLTSISFRHAFLCGIRKINRDFTPYSFDKLLRARLCNRKLDSRIAVPCRAENQECVNVMAAQLI
ncbi:hypothetical protein ABIB48_000652 [Arthrobacter sp. UYCu511]